MEPRGAKETKNGAKRSKINQKWSQEEQKLEADRARWPKTAPDGAREPPRRPNPGYGAKPRPQNGCQNRPKSVKQSIKKFIIFWITFCIVFSSIFDPKIAEKMFKKRSKKMKKQVEEKCWKSEKPSKVFESFLRSRWYRILKKSTRKSLKKLFKI